MLCLAQARIATITNSIGSSKKQHQQHPPRVAQVQGVLAQHEAGLERYTGAEVSDALLLVDGCCGPALNHLGHSRVGKTLATTLSRSAFINASNSWLQECNRYLVVNSLHHNIEPQHGNDTACAGG